MLFIFVSPSLAFAQTATEMMAEANLAGGLVVYIGADRELLTALNARDASVVHVLGHDVNEVAAMRAFLRSKGRPGGCQ